MQKKCKKYKESDFNHATRDLFDAIEKGNYLKWDLHVQVMQLEETDSLDLIRWDPTESLVEASFPTNGSRDNDVKS